MSDTYKRAASEDYVTRAIAAHANTAGIHVTAEQKTAWTAKYDKPSGGIPKTDLASAVQTSLGKADSALQSQDIAGKVDSSDLFSDGKIKAALLPSYVDDVLEYSSTSGFPSTGETGKIYVAKDESKTYRWSGTQYIEISPAPDLSNYVQKEAGKGLFSGSYNDLSDKPTIPAAVTVDSTLSDSSTNPVQNKVVKAALDGKATAAQGAKADAALSRTEAVAGFTEWTCDPATWDGHPISIVEDSFGILVPFANGVVIGTGDDDLTPASVLPTSLTWTGDNKWEGSPQTLTATRTRLPTMADIPTKTSDLQNDSGFLTSHQDISGKESTSNKVTSISAASTDAQYPSAKCVWDNLRYSLAAVTPTVASGAAAAVLNDRAVNAVDLSAEQSAVTSIAFTAPAAVTGKARDFIVRVTLPAQSDAPQWSVNATLENADGELPALTADASAAATTLLYFTETAAGVFLVKGEAAKAVA